MPSVMCQLPAYIPKWNHEFHHSVFGDTTLEEHLKQPFYKTVNAKTQDFFLHFTQCTWGKDLNRTLQKTCKTTLKK
jgi:hypothetical protein